MFNTPIIVELPLITYTDIWVSLVPCPFWDGWVSLVPGPFWDGYSGVLSTREGVGTQGVSTRDTQGGVLEYLLPGTHPTRHESCPGVDTLLPPHY